MENRDKLRLEKVVLNIRIEDGHQVAICPRCGSADTAFTELLVIFPCGLQLTKDNNSFWRVAKLCYARNIVQYANVRFMKKHVSKLLFMTNQYETPMA